MRIAVAIPIYLSTADHLAYLQRTIASIHSEENELVFLPVENHVSPEFVNTMYATKDPEIQQHTVIARQPQSVTQAWNDAIVRAKDIGCMYILIMNQDVILHPKSIDNLVTFANWVKDPSIVLYTMTQVEQPDHLINYQGPNEWAEHPNFSSFMVGTDFLDVMGRFDENFMPAYFEDNDMHARIALSNKKAVAYQNAKFFHYGSRTIHGGDPDISSQVSFAFGRNAEYFKRKWGVYVVGDVEEMREKYWKHPYNDETRPLDYCENK